MRACAKVFVVLTIVLLSAVADAQQGKVPRIGYVSTNYASAPGPLVESFRQGLREFGYIEGKNITVEFRYAEGNDERMRALVKELVQLNVDALVIPTLDAVRTAKQATTSIPIVMVVNADPVATGLIGSLARPGGNLTGVSRLQLQLSGKRLELLKETVPRAARVAVLRDAESQAAQIGLKEYESAAPGLKVQVQPLDVHGPAPELEQAFRAAASKHTEALVTITTTLLFRRQKEIVELAKKQRLPSMFEGSSWVDLGGLISYSTNDAEVFRRAAYYVDKIIKGAKPADLPVEQPTKFEMVINLKTAKQIGVTIPPNVLARADRVIK
ncbi:MAG TPA: ABC transporter substrate-binding protein [Candidatus Binatia bacterium]|jgi:putative ABC transport system substrate-binding protein